MTQEVVREENGAVRESGYVSFMTSSPEKNSDQAWQAFVNRPRELTLAVACGLASAARYRWALEHETVPAGVTWMDCPALMEKFRTREVVLREAAVSGDRLPDGGENVYPTFLFAVRKAILSGTGGRCTFIHNAKLYELRTRFSEAEGSLLLTGHIVEHDSSNESEFRVWLDTRDPEALPTKIEFRPKSFLRLTFHLDPAAGGPSCRRLLDG